MIYNSCSTLKKIIHLGVNFVHVEFKEMHVHSIPAFLFVIGVFFWGGFLGGWCSLLVAVVFVLSSLV